MANKPIRVLCGFPGVGKSRIITKHDDFIDLDSALFAKENPNRFVQYVDRIESLLETTDKGILVSTHRGLLEELTKRNIDVVLVFPVRSARAAFIQRYINRGDWVEFLIQMCDNWDKYHDEMESVALTENSLRVILEDRQYLSDRITYTTESGFTLR